MLQTTLTLVIGLIIGIAIGYLIAALRHKSRSADGALLDDYKKQLEAERSKTESSIKLTAELTAMKSTVDFIAFNSAVNLMEFSVLPRSASSCFL